MDKIVIKHDFSDKKSDIKRINQSMDDFNGYDATIGVVSWIISLFITIMIIMTMFYVWGIIICAVSVI